MMSPLRLKKEQEVLAERVPPNMYRFEGLNSFSPYLLIAAMTNSGKVYTLKIHLETFPENVPQVEVLNPIRDKKGKKLNEVSGQMHVLGSLHGHTLICHYSAASWTPQVSLYKIFIKCRLWFEMYEEHLKTGYNIDTFLKHQS
ncbi:MAG: hypothetical protein IJ650_07190 [Paludibacteraceae bacterium]|nr:hypothetical protein [Paludibacteraceae bacterium]